MNDCEYCTFTQNDTKNLLKFLIIIYLSIYLTNYVCILFQISIQNYTGKGFIPRSTSTGQIVAVFCPTCTGYKKIRCRQCGGKCLKCSI